MENIERLLDDIAHIQQLKMILHDSGAILFRTGSVYGTKVKKLFTSVSCTGYALKRTGQKPSAYFFIPTSDSKLYYESFFFSVTNIEKDTNNDCLVIYEDDNISITHLAMCVLGASKKQASIKEIVDATENRFF